MFGLVLLGILLKRSEQQKCKAQVGEPATFLVILRSGAVQIRDANNDEAGLLDLRGLLNGFRVCGLGLAELG